MNTTERNWSSINDYEGGNFGFRSFFTREEWIEQAMEWSLDREDDDELEAYLNDLDDESLMAYIQDMWMIEIRETTWLKVDNKCYWKDPAGETSGIYTILEIRYNPNDIDDALTDDTIILIGNEHSEAEVTLNEIYGLTDKACPRCGHSLYVSDLCRYPYVCLECDENFDRNEAI